MPIPLFFHILEEGVGSVPWLLPALKLLPCVAILYVLKTYFGGAVNKSERKMHGKVVMITGGTSGIGAAIVHDLAARGAQIILLTHHSTDDPFLQEYIEDVRDETKNELVYAESVNLASLHSIRKFATRWVDNAPPRRLDMIILCASTFRSRFGPNEPTLDGVEACWGLNYLANFQLLSILSPALRVQPPDRDVRIIFATCGSYVGGNLKHMKNSKSPLPKKIEYETSKLALMVFAQAFQKHLNAYERPDKMPMSSRVISVDPGWVRTPGMRQWLSMGSLWGLILYVILWPIYWLTLKSPTQGAQSFLKAAMEADYGRGSGGRLIRECREWKYSRPEVGDEEIQKKLWQYSENQIVALEKESVLKRTDGNKMGTKENSKTVVDTPSRSKGSESAAQKEKKARSRKNKNV